MTENDVTWPEVTISDPEETSFDRKSPGSGCRRLKNLRLVCVSLPTRLWLAVGGRHLTRNDVT